MTYKAINRGWQGKQVSSFSNFRRDRKPNKLPVPYSDLVLFYDYGDGLSFPNTSTTVVDLAGTVNGTLTNGPTYSTVYNGIITLDGINDYVDSGTGLSQSGGYTLFTIFNASSVTGAQGLLCRTNGNAGGFVQNYTLFLQGNKIRTGSSSNSYRFAETSDTVNTNRWYCVAGTFNNSDKILRIYLNGILNGSSTALTVNPPTTGTQYVQMGCTDGPDVANRLTGSLGLSMIYSRTLTDSEIWRLFNTFRVRFGL